MLLLFVMFPAGFLQAKPMGKPAGKVEVTSVKALASSPTLHQAPLSIILLSLSGHSHTYPYPTAATPGIIMPYLPAGLLATTWELLNNPGSSLNNSSGECRIVIIKQCILATLCFITTSLSNGNSGPSYLIVN